MFRRFKLNVTWGPINYSSSDIPLFFFSLYLEQSIIDVLEFPYLCRTVRYFTTKLNNKEKIDSYIPYTTHSPKSPLLYLTAFSSGQFWGIYPNYHPNTYPTTAAYPEGRKLWFPNCIWSGIGHVREESPVVVGYQFSLGAVTNYAQDLRDVLIHIWHFPLRIEASLPYVWPFFFLSHPSTKIGMV